MRAALTMARHAGAMTTQTKTKTLTAALALAFAVGLSACGGQGDAGAGVNPQTPSADQPAQGGAGSSDDTDEGTSGDDATDDTDDTGTADDDATGEGQDSTAGAADLTATALLAVATAEQETGGTAYEIDDQDDDGTWEVDVALEGRSVEVTVSADGTTVVGTEDDDDLDEEDRAGLAAATITLQDAIRVAVEEVGGVLDDAELEEEDGQHYWEVSVDTTDGDDDVEVKVSVAGTVLSVDR